MFTKVLKGIKNFYYLVKAISFVAKGRKNPMAAVSMVWGSIFNEGLQFNWGIRFVSKDIMAGGGDSNLKMNAPDAIFATIPKICCVLVCLENLEEATKQMNAREWAFYVIQGIAHEYRHAQQIEYFESIGLDSNTALHYLACTYCYLTSPIESDAIQYSRNITSITYKNGCLKLRSKYISVSEAMKEVAEEVRQHPQVFDYKKA